MSENFLKLPEAIQKFTTPYTDLIVTKLNNGTYDVIPFSKSDANQKLRHTNAGYLYASGKFVLTDKAYTYNPETDTWTKPWRSFGDATSVSPSSSASGFSADHIVYTTVAVYNSSSFTTMTRDKDEPVPNLFVPNPTPFPEAVLNDSNFQKEFNQETDAVVVILGDGISYVYVYPGQKEAKFTIYYSSAAGSTGWHVCNENPGYTVLEYDKATWTYQKTTYDTTSTKTKVVKETLGLFHELFAFTNVDFYNENNKETVIYPAQSFDFENAATLPESFEVNPASIEDFIGTQHQLTVNVLPEEAENKAFTLASENSTVATVTDTGLVELKAEGQTVITITSVAVPDLIHQVPVTVNRPFEKPLIHSFTMTPEQPKEGENVSFIYDATYDRASFVAEEWENKQASYEAGSHTVKVRVQDSNGLWSDWAVLSFNVEAVYSLPTISNLRMEPSTPSVGEKVSFIYDKNMDSRLTLKSENWGNKKDSYESGTHTVTLSITDSADQTSNTLSHTFTIEKPLENFTISSLKMTPPNPKAGEKVEFSYEVNNDDRLTIVEEKWENKQASYEAGTHTVKVSAVDSAGRTSNTLSLTFEVAYVPEKPVLTVINMTPANPYHDEPIEFTYQAAIDEQATIKEEIWENKQSMYTPGRHEVALTIVDSFNQSSNRLTYAFEVKRRQQAPVIRDLVVKTQNPTTNDVIEFEYGMTLDPEATLLKENWENKREKYPAGVHTVKLSITDSLNQVSNVLEVTFTVLDAEALPDVPSQFPYIYDIVIDPPQPRAGELLSYSYTVALEAGSEIETMSWKGRRMVYEEAGEIELTLKIIDSKGQSSEKTVHVSIDEPSELPREPKPTRVKHLEVTRWDSAYKRFMVLEGREK